MKSKTMVLMFIAVACGLVASYLTSKMLANQAQAQEKVKVLVSKQKIGLGTQIKNPQELFVEKEFIKGTEPRLAITKFEDLKDKRVNKNLNQDYHITPEDFFDKDNGGLSVVIAPGYRAYSIRVAPDTDVGGFVMPNTHVDIVATIRSGDVQARIILEDVLVLAVDMQHVKAEDKNAMAASTVTLQVKPDDAEKLTVAQTMGELRLILRSFGDKEKGNTRGKKQRDVLQGNGTDNSSDTAEEGGTKGGASAAPGKVPDAPKEEKLKEEAPPRVEVAMAKPKRHVMTIINGTVQSRAIFEPNEEGELTTREEGNRPPPEPKKIEPQATPEASAPPAAPPAAGAAPAAATGTPPAPPAAPGKQPTNGKASNVTPMMPE